MTTMLMAANWKMHKTRSEAQATAQDLVARVAERLPKDREVLIIPTFTALQTVQGAVEGSPGFAVGGQNFYPDEQGAYTGEVSPGMLLDCGCSYALAGHSERRHVMGEEDTFVGRKVLFGLDKGLRMILCVGETLEQREQDRVQEVLQAQLRAGLADVDQDIDPSRLAVAYEPVWAIGTGKVAGPEEIAQAHAFVRQQLQDLLPGPGPSIRILYGGSVKPDNCAGIIGLDNVEGVLVGGASLNAASFADIVLAGI